MASTIQTNHATVLLYKRILRHIFGHDRFNLQISRGPITTDPFCHSTLILQLEDLPAAPFIIPLHKEASSLSPEDIYSTITDSYPELLV